MSYPEAIELKIVAVRLRVVLASASAVAVLALIGWALGIDPRVLIGGAEMMSGGSQTQQQQTGAGTTGAPSDEMGQFVSAVLGSTEAEWTEIFCSRRENL